MPAFAPDRHGGNGGAVPPRARLNTLDGADPRGTDFTAEAIPVPGRAGDLVVRRHELPHGASPDAADRPRLVQYVDRSSPGMAHNPVWP